MVSDGVLRYLQLSGHLKYTALRIPADALSDEVHELIRHHSGGGLPDLGLSSIVLNVWNLLVICATVTRVKPRDRAISAFVFRFLQSVNIHGT
ncbi:hypothetical protein RB195_024434 [Necator americanus]|uniref:Uncharacterized protein n=1 Tax=Necator americanus TaxID=51031 RepID=A0ABR1EN61_NECAM